MGVRALFIGPCQIFNFFSISVFVVSVAFMVSVKNGVLSNNSVIETHKTDVFDLHCN